MESSSNRSIARIPAFVSGPFFSHLSRAVQQPVASAPIPVVEVHISNVHQREAFRHTSLISAACSGVICGFGTDSYRLGIEALAQMHES